jgi:chromosome partitioning protein
VRAVLVCSVVSQKGGSGKTTLALHVGVAAAASGQKTLIIDLDPQGSAERWSELRDADEPTIVAGQAERLEDMLRAAAQHAVGLAIVDTPPKVDRTALIAAKAADVVLIPSRGTVLDLQAIGDTVDLLKLAELHHKAVIILNAMPAKAAEVKAVREAAEMYGLEVIEARLRERPAYSKSLEEGQGVTEAEPGGAAATEIRNVYEWLCERAGIAAPRKAPSRSKRGRT